MTALTNSILVIFHWTTLATVVGLSGCATSKAWIVKKEKDGGTIAYAQPGILTSENDVADDFARNARKICGKREWLITKEVLPAPSSGINGAVNLSKGDHASSVTELENAGLQMSSAHRARRSPDAKVEWGNPLKSHNEAFIKCANK